MTMISALRKLLKWQRPRGTRRRKRERRGKIEEKGATSDAFIWMAIVLVGKL